MARRTWKKKGLFERTVKIRGGTSLEVENESDIPSFGLSRSGRLRLDGKGINQHEEDLGAEAPEIDTG